MRLHVCHPKSSGAMTRTIAASARRAARPGAETLATTGPAGSPASVEGHRDGARALTGLLARIAEAEEAGVEAHVIDCFDDTGLAREKVG